MLFAIHPTDATIGRHVPLLFGDFASLNAPSFRAPWPGSWPAWVECCCFLTINFQNGSSTPNRCTHSLYSAYTVHCTHLLCACLLYPVLRNNNRVRLVTKRIQSRQTAALFHSRLLFSFLNFESPTGNYLPSVGYANLTANRKLFGALLLFSIDSFDVRWPASLRADRSSVVHLPVTFFRLCRFSGSIWTNHFESNRIALCQLH